MGSDHKSCLLKFLESGYFRKFIRRFGTGDPNTVLQVKANLVT